jgi:site-specific DNA-methyltransferase (adenine-specific)
MLEQHGINIYNRDCLEAMREMPDNAFDLAIVDPPYGIERFQRGSLRFDNTEKAKDGLKWDIKPSQEYFDELFRVSKNQIIWGANNFTLPNYKGFVVWKKKTIGDTFTMSMAELAYLSDGLATTSKVFECAPQDPDRIHPTQKPVALYKWLLDKYAKEGDKILDTHGGSMSIAIACYEYGYDLSLFELDTDYYNAGRKRVEDYIQSHPKLF